MTIIVQNNYNHHWYTFNAKRVGTQQTLCIVSSNGRGIEICNKKYIFFENWQRVDINCSMDYSSRKFVGASTLRRSRWKWNLRRRSVVPDDSRKMVWKTRRWKEAKRHRPQICCRSVLRSRKKPLDQFSRQVLWHIHAPLGLNTVDVLFDASSDEIDHITFFVFFSTFHLFVIYRWKTESGLVSHVQDNSMDCPCFTTGTTYSTIYPKFVCVHGCE